MYQMNNSGRKAYMNIFLNFPILNQEYELYQAANIGYQKSE